MNGLPKWAIWLGASGVVVAHLLGAAVIGYLLWQQATPDESPPAPPVMDAVPSPTADPLTQDWIEAEATRLLEQAQKDVTSPGSPCYGKSPACPLWHYRQDAEIRRRALELIGGTTAP